MYLYFFKTESGCDVSVKLVFVCRVFGVDVQGRDCGDKVSEWLTRFLESDKPVRLVHYETDLKPQRPHEKEPLFPEDDKV